MALLDLEALSFSYGGVSVLESVDLKVDDGSTHAVIGPNGAGKSTLFSLIAGELRPSHGDIRLAGKSILSLSPPHRTAKGGIARAFQVARVFDSLSVAENVQTALCARDRSLTSIWTSVGSRKRAMSARAAAIEDLGLEDIALRIAGELSQGDRKRLEISLALVLRPKLLMLDEPTAGMSVDETARTIDLCLEIRQRNDVSILITEHNMDVVFNLAQRLTVLSQGRVISSGLPEEVRQNAEVRHAYFAEAS